MSSPTPLQISPIQSCSNCQWWKGLRKGRTCKQHRKVKGKSTPGTPSDYWCDEYTPMTTARCGECIHWVSERLPRKKAPCSELGLTDNTGKERTESSIFCKHFQQVPQAEVVNNPLIRVNGGLVTILDLMAHSDTHGILIRCDHTSGLLIQWEPEGVGRGSFRVAPVGLTMENGHPKVIGHSTDPRSAQNVLFAGTATVDTKSGVGQWQGQNITPGSGDFVTDVRFAVTSTRRRGAKVMTQEAGVLETVPVKRIQDEPWGSDWEDLSEQMSNLLDAGTAPTEAAKMVRRRYEKDIGKKMGKDTALRLQAQLKVAHRGVEQ